MKLTSRIMMAGAMVIAAPLALPTLAAAQEFPLKAGAYTRMSAIYVKDGGTYAYANHLANVWAKQQAYAKSKGWITDYKIYVVLDPRDNEPNLYLTYTTPKLENSVEEERRDKEMEAYMQKTGAQMETESGNRATIRTQRGSMMLQEYTVRK